MIRVSDHAVTRGQQRAIRPHDIDLMLECGTGTHDGILLRRADAERAIARRRAEIRQLERLSGAFIVVQQDTLVTSYHTNRKKERQILRDLHRRMS